MKFLMPICAITFSTHVVAIHHMSSRVSPRQSSGSTVPLTIQNNCGETIYPGILTQSGTGPSSTGFELTSGSSMSQTVSENWQGRVWGRTNCSFNAQGTSNTGSTTACSTGDCNGALACTVTGDVPVTLVEFTMDAGDGHTYYDISLVDGYNIPVGLVMLAQGNATLEDIPPNLTNPTCVGSVGYLASSSYDPYVASPEFLGTNASFPLPWETTVTSSYVDTWCPSDLQVSASSTSSSGIYDYPDTDLTRPYFDPCYSACAKYDTAAYCCTGSHDSSSTCSTNYYSQVAKKVCPDAYSYAFDDSTSTFIIPAGGGFEVIFCPSGRSTNILSQYSSELVQLVQTGSVSIST